MFDRRTTRFQGLLALPLLLAFVDPDPFATSVVDYSPGGGGGIFVAAQSLGGPRGGGALMGSLDVASLGVGGSLTLGFDVTLTDGPGADLTVFENGFFDTGFNGVHSEVAWVEVSSDGASFARFPAKYGGGTGPFSPFGTTALGTYGNLAGSRCVHSNVDTNAIPPLAAAQAGGTAFDLADLVDHPLVLSNDVDLAAIQFVRLVDSVDGELDADGAVVWDNSGTAGSADIDAVAVLNHTGNQTSDRPVVEMWIDGMDRLHVLFEDLDGVEDIVHLRTTVSQIPVNFFALLPEFKILEITDTRLHLWLKHPISGTGWLADLTVSVRDASGQRCSEHVVLQG